MSDPLRKVLILSTSAGAGHVRAAQALITAFHQQSSAFEVTHLDTLDYTSAAFRMVYSKAYIDMANSVPDILGWLYDATDKPNSKSKRMTALERLNVGLFIKVLRRINPDVIVCTHFLPADIIGYLRQKHGFKAKHAVVITDFDAHSFWLNATVDAYFVATAEVAEYVRLLGVKTAQTFITGIPIDPVFSLSKNTLELRAKLGIDNIYRTILISAGGHGVGNIDALVTSLSTISLPINILAMCGTNTEAYSLLMQKKTELPATIHLHPIGFTTAMDEYMSIADIMIGKTGGLTTSEAMAKGLAIVVVNPIPGQEERNADYVMEEGIAIKCNNIVTLGYKVEQLLLNPMRLAMMQQRSYELSHPHSAEEIVSTLCRIFESE